MNLIALKDSFIYIINSYNNLFLNMNSLNKIIGNNSDTETIKLRLIKEPINMINKDISQSKHLLENFFKKLNDDINKYSNTNNLTVIIINNNHL